MKPLKLLPSEYITKTSEVDRAEWNYRSMLGIVQKVRFSLIDHVLDNIKVSRLLEIGYGSGIFLPHLAQYCDEIYGLDPHSHNENVADTLKSLGINALLTQGRIDEYTGYPDEFFDVIVAVSTLEFVEDMEKGCEEIKRILKNDGRLMLVTPAHFWVYDFMLKILTNENARDIYSDRRESLEPILMNHFDIDEKLYFPKFLSNTKPVYTALCLKNKS